MKDCFAHWCVHWLSREIRYQIDQGERAVRVGTERLISATAGSRPVPSLNFGEACEAAPSSLTSHQAVRRAVRLAIILLEKIL